MAVDEVIRRVEDDLTRGHTFVAIQRLTTLVQTNPKDLDVRLRLAQVHLATGNFVQAGRWFYLTEARDERATAAFEKAYRNPRARESALGWTFDAQNDPHHVRDVLAPLRRQAERAEREAKAERRSTFGGRVALLVLFSIPVFFVIGVVTVVRWVWPG